jgi:hypothetical protein
MISAEAVQAANFADGPPRHFASAQRQRTSLIEEPSSAGRSVAWLSF